MQIPPAHLPTCPPAQSGSPLRLGDYELLEEIGRGGMGVVYKARQVSLNRVVALKMTLAGPLAQPDAVQRFRAEAETIGRLRHEHIVGVHEIGESEGRLFFSMDYIAGASLASLVRDRPLPAREAASLLKTIAEAVAYAHSLGVIHRDLKPSNILFDERGQPRVTDFGLAKTVSGDSDLTLSGQALGSPSFCAPEQAAGRRGEIGPGSDIYSLGAMLYFLLTGRPPLLAETLEQTLWQVLNTEPVAPRLLNPSVPPDLQTICLKCLAKDLARRYASATELAEELGRFLGGEAIQARPAGAFEKAWRWCRRHPAPATAAAGVVVLLSAVAVLTSVANVRVTQKELALRHRGYAADMRLAQRAIESDNLGLANYFLNNYRPPLGDPNLRGWEWRYFWLQSRSEALFRVGRHPQVVLALAFSPDGSRLASAGSEGEVKLWDLASRAELATRRHAGRVNALAFSADGNALASAGHDGEICLRNGVTLTDLAEPLRQDGEVIALQFTDHGRKLVALSLDPAAGWLRSRATIWNLASRGKDHEQTIRASSCATLSPDGRMAVSAGMSGSIWLWDLAAERERAAWTGHSSRVTALALSPNGQWLASGSFDHIAKVWDVATQSEQTMLGGFNGMVSAAAFSPDGRILAAASDDQAVRLWETASWEEIATFRGHMSAITSLAFSPKGDLLATGGKGGEIRAWNPFLKPSRTNYHRLAVGGRVGCARENAVVLRPGAELAVIDLGTGVERSRLAVAAASVSAVAVSGDASWVAAGTQDGELFLWNTITPDPPRRARLEATAVTALAFSPDARTVAAVIANRMVQLVEVGSGARVGTLNADRAPLDPVEFSPDGRWLAVGCEDGTTLLWDCKRQKVRSQLERHNLGVTAVAFSPDSRRIATTSDDATVMIWDTQSARRLSMLQGVPGALWSVSWSPDGRRLATGTSGSTVIIWDLASGQEVATLSGHTHSLVRAHFLSDGDTLATYAGDELFLWRAPAFPENK